MIPFVAGGGLLIALGFLLGGYDIALGTKANDILANNSLVNLPDGGLALYLGAVLFKIGALSMGFLVPALAGYIAYAIADRPGIAPGFVAGAVAGFMGAGFLGGIVGGLLAGYIAHLIGTWSGAALAPRPDARRDHSAAGLHLRLRPDVPVPRRTDRRPSPPD